MGLFEEAGRRFERFKQEATAAAQQDAAYKCVACGERLFTDMDECPECGAEEIEATESDDDTAETRTDERKTADGSETRESPTDDEYEE